MCTVSCSFSWELSTHRWRSNARGEGPNSAVGKSCCAWITICSECQQRWPRILPTPNQSSRIRLFGVSVHLSHDRPHARLRRGATEGHRPPRRHAISRVAMASICDQTALHVPSQYMPCYWALPRKFLIRTASVVSVPRERASRPSRDHWKLKSLPEAKCVIGVAGPPATGCCHMLPTPFTSLMKETARPSGVQDRGGGVAVSGNWKTLAGGPPAMGMIARFAGWFGCEMYEQAIHFPSGDTDG